MAYESGLLKGNHGAFHPGDTLFFLCRLFLGGVFLYACYDKILHPKAFAQAVYNYQILPDALVNIASLVLPWLEMLIGLCLLLNVWMPGATLLSTGLLTVFMCALIYNEIRGLNVQCGCFSTQSTEGPADVWTVVRDGGFLAVSVYLTLRIFFSKRSRNSHLPI